MTRSRPKVRNAGAADGGAAVALGNTAISDLLHAIKGAIEAVKGEAGLSVGAVKKWSKKERVAIPAVSLQDGSKRGAEHAVASIAGAACESVAVVGSFLLGTLVGASAIDVAAQMDAGALCEGDERDHRYLAKRATFLAKIGAALKALPQLKGAALSWASFRGHILRPVLVIAPQDHAGLVIRVHATVALGALPIDRLVPSSSAVSKAFLLATKAAAGLSSDEAAHLAEAPTPIYNSLLLADMLMVAHLKMIHSECKRIPSLCEAIKLGKAWIAQCGYDRFAFHMSGFQFSMVATYLARRGTVTATMGEVQIFKAVMAFLATTDWAKTVVYFDKPGSDGKARRQQASAPPPDAKDDYLVAFPASLVEPIAGMNVLFDWTADVVGEVQREARRTLQALSQEHADFGAVFINDRSGLLAFDACYAITDLAWMPNVRANFHHYQNQYVPEDARMRIISKRLKYALGSRVSQVALRALLPAPTAGLESFSMPVTTVEVGLVLDRTECERLVELGPLAGGGREAERELFRSFWRERAQLRRFADGTIREAVAWDRFANCRHLVIDDILSFVSGAYLDGAPVSSLAGSLDFALDQQESFTPLMAAFAALSRDMRGLAEMPLAVSRCELVGSASRYATVEPLVPLQHADLRPSDGTLPGHLAVNDVLVYLEGSNRWPEEYYGLTYAKQAFAVLLCRRLQALNGVVTSITPAYFDVLHSNFTFRCHIYNPDEVRLMQAQGLDASSLSCLFGELPRHSRALSALASRNALFGPTCRLVKRWLACQMYSSVLAEETIELLVASTFTQGGGDAPGTPLAGFARTLHLIASFDWRHCPLLVNFAANEDASTAGRGSAGSSGTWSVTVAREKFLATPKEERATLWLAPSYIEGGACSLWSVRSRMSREDLAALQQLARGALCRLQEGLKMPHGDMTALFRCALDRFTFTIALRREGNNRRQMRMDIDDNYAPSRGRSHDGDDDEHVGLSREKDLGAIINGGAKASRLLYMLPGFDPIAALMGDLCEAFPEASFYYDKYGGDYIGVSVAADAKSPARSYEERIIDFCGNAVAGSGSSS